MSTVVNAGPIPQGNYVPAARYGDWIISSGMTPRENGVLLYSGQLRADQPLETYHDAVTQAVSNALTAVKQQLKEDEAIAQIVTMTVYLFCNADFTAHSKLADFASEYLYRQLGLQGIGSRTAIGVASLPGHAPVEIQLTAAVCRTATP